MGKREAHPLTQFKLSMLPFADAGSDGFPLKRLLRLSLFQISCGLATAMLLGTLNRVMIVELSVPAFLVALMVALPVLIAPFRALLGFRSDNYRSSIGWKRVPYMWFGSLWQFGGLSIMPFSILILSGSQEWGPAWSGEVLAAMAFVMTGLGLHMTQTAGLALACDQATDDTRPRVVALLYMMFLIGIGFSAVVVGALLENFSEMRLVQVVQGTALITLLLNLAAVWKQESFRPMSKKERALPMPKFSEAWIDLMRGGVAGRVLLVVALGTCAFSMQDVLLEPYGGEVLGLSISATTYLTAVWALGALIAFGAAARWLSKGVAHYRLAVFGLVAGIAAFGLVIASEFTGWTFYFYVGAALIGFGAGLFAVAMLTGAMTMPVLGNAGRGLALGAWGAAQATAMGLGVAMGGGLRDGVARLIESGSVGTVRPSLAYSVVYQIEIVLLIITLLVALPLVRATREIHQNNDAAKIGLSEFPT